MEIDNLLKLRLEQQIMTTESMQNAINACRMIIDGNQTAIRDVGKNVVCSIKFTY